MKPGDRVYTSGSVSGTYAELALCETSQVHPLPPTISFAQGAALGVPYATAYYALFYRAHALPGETVLIHGATGGVGTAATQIARAWGLSVIGTGGTPKGRELVSQNGARHVLDHCTPDYLDQLMTLTQGRGVDVIIEMLANVNLARDLKILTQRGRVAIVGSRGTVEIDPRDTMTRNASILGMTLFNATEKELFSIHSALVSGLIEGTLRPVIGQEIPLEQAPRAHEDVMKPGSYGKITLIP
jgi:NADPH2:quinone reductase